MRIIASRWLVVFIKGNTNNNKIRWKSIGILGGMGPESTALFYTKIIQLVQKKYNAQYDSDYPEIFIYNLPLADIVDCENVKDKNEIFDSFLQAIKKFELFGVDFIAIPCNTVIPYLEKIRNKIKVPFIDTIEITADFIKSKGYKTVGLIATETTINSRVYEISLSKSNISVILPAKQNIKQITNIILNIMSGKKSKEDKRILNEIINSLSDKGAECVVLGCTDLPLLIQQKDSTVKLIDTLDILTEEIVKAALINNSKNNNVDDNNKGYNNYNDDKKMLRDGDEENER